MDSLKFIQGQSWYLAGSGCTATATSITLTSMKYPGDTTDVVTADIGSICYAVLEPETPREENISFTGITANADGSRTLTGVVRGLAFKAPYTQDITLRLAHSGGSLFRISNTAPFYDSMTSKVNDETIAGIYTFTDPNVPRMDTAHSYVAGEEEYFATKRYADGISTAGAPNASTTQKGIVEEATQAEVDAKTAAGGTAARLFVNPTTLRSTQLSDYVLDTGAADAYAIAPSPVISAYAAGQRFSFLASHTNTGASTLAVSGLASPKNILKRGTLALSAGDILVNGVYEVEYDGTQFQLMSPIATPQQSQSGREVYAATSVGTDAYAVTIVPTPTLVNGMQLRVKLDVVNTGAATLAVNGGSALAIVKGVATALETGDLLANEVITLSYNSTGTVWQLVDTPASLVVGITAPIVTNHAHKQNSVVSTFTASTATGAINYAHGLGAIPNRVKVTLIPQTYNATVRSFGRYERAANTYACVWQANGATAPAGASTDRIAITSDGNGNFNIATVTTCDATNVGLTWTKTLNGGLDCNLLIEVGV